MAKKTPVRAKAGTSKAEAAARRMRFVNAYIANGGNATHAAKDAGYSEKTAYRTGADLLKEPQVKALIAERAKAVADKYALTPELVARSIVQELTFDPDKLYHEDGRLKAIPDLDEDTRMALTSVEVEEIGGGDKPLIRTKKIKWATRNQAREQAMKHLGMFAEDNKQKLGMLENVPPEVLKLIRDRLEQMSADASVGRK